MVYGGLRPAVLKGDYVERPSGRPRQKPTRDDIRAVPTADENESVAHPEAAA